MNEENIKSIDDLINSLTHIRNTKMRFKNSNLRNLIDSKFKELQYELIELKMKEYERSN